MLYLEGIMALLFCVTKASLTARLYSYCISYNTKNRADFLLNVPSKQHLKHRHS